MKFTAVLGLALCLIISSSFSQLGFLKKKAEEKITKEIEKKIEGSEEEDKDKDKEKDPSTKNKDEKKDEAKPVGLQSYSKYDFVPGEKVIFFEDFSQDNIGDFPALWNTNGSAEVVTTNLYPGRWMKFITNSAIWTDNLLTLPDNYTIEYDVIPIKNEEGNMQGYTFRLMQAINVKSYDGGGVPGKNALAYTLEYHGRSGYNTYMNEEAGRDLGLRGYKDERKYYQTFNQLYHIAIWIQKARVRIYLDENKIFDLPRAFSLPGIKMDRIRFEEGAAMVSNIRIAVGTPDLRSKLMTEGKLVSYGLYFDINKENLKPESYATLKGIADVLKENPGVRVKIVGHTDSDGADEANLDLSKRRAASVKKELVNTFGIEESRLESDGMGESQPIVGNDTPANKALNRRVEFIKL